jgi:cytochrome c-type biogenesis protein CcmE
MKLRYGIVVLLCIGAVVWMVVLLQRNVVFFKTVSEAVQDQAGDGYRTMRIGGGVVPGSIEQSAGGVEFQLTEGQVTVHVRHTGTEPSLFKDCAPVVAEGHWSEQDPRTFESTRLLIKHDNDYEVPQSSDPRTVCPPDPMK